MKKILIPALACMTLGTSAFAGGDVVEAPVIEIPTVVEAEAPFVNLGLYTAGISVGTLGVGLDVSVPFSKFSDGAWAKHFNFRGNVNGFTYSRTLNDIVPSSLQDDFNAFGGNADGQLDLLTAGLLVDYYPFEQAQFRLSAGVYYNANQLSVVGDTSNSTDVATFNNIDFKLNELGSVTGKTVFDKTGPYVGMGWGNRGAEAGWSWSLDIGALYQNVPQAEMKATMNPNIPALTDAAGVPLLVNGVAYTQATLDAEVNAEVAKVNQEIKDSDYAKYTKFYPVIRFGITYSF